jgi:hypothetical protein
MLNGKVHKCMFLLEKQILINRLSLRLISAGFTLWGHRYMIGGLGVPRLLILLEKGRSPNVPQLGIDSDRGK